MRCISVLAGWSARDMKFDLVFFFKLQFLRSEQDFRQHNGAMKARWSDD